MDPMGQFSLANHRLSRENNFSLGQDSSLRRHASWSRWLYRARRWAMCILGEVLLMEEIRLTTWDVWNQLSKSLTIPPIPNL